MNLSDAKLVGQSYTDVKTGVTFWMHPSIPMGYFATREYFVSSGLSPTDAIIDMFLTGDSFILAIETERDDLSLQAYLNMRVGKTIAERYELFLTLVDFGYSDAISSAYNATRVDEFPSDIPPEIASDENLKKSTSRTSSNRKSKLNKKQARKETSATKNTTTEAVS